LSASTNTQGDWTTPSSSQPGATSSNQQIDFVFFAKIENVQIIANLLNTLYTGKKELANVVINPKGIKVTVENARAFQANAFLQSDLFQEYTFKSEEKEEFSVQLSALIDCLNVYGTQTNTAQLQIAYQSYGKPLLLMIEENDVLTDCGIHPSEPLPLTQFNIHTAEVISILVMKSQSLRDAFNELDWSNDFLTWELSPNAPHFRLKAQGTGTMCQVDYPQDCEVFNSFECTRAIKKDFKMKLLQPCLKALTIAERTQVRMNELGLLSLQHMILTVDGQYAFVDFFIMPMDDEESD